MANETTVAVRAAWRAWRVRGARLFKALAEGLVGPLVTMALVALPVFGLVALAGLAFAG